MARLANGQALDACFAALVSAAIAGERCPQNGSIGVHKQYTSQLARDGWIKIEISGQNYRAITILTGPHKGKSTAADPSKQRVWRVIDANGSHRVGLRSDQMPRVRHTGGKVSAPKPMGDWDYRV